LERGQPLPRYFFALRWSDKVHDDTDGTVLSGADAAYAYAKRIIGELKEAGGYDDPGLTMVVMGDNGDTIHSIPF
jgi:hypothetical protein